MKSVWHNSGVGRDGGSKGPKTISPPVTWGDLITLFNLLSYLPVVSVLSVPMESGQRRVFISGVAIL